MQNSWWRLFLTSKGSLTFAVEDGVNRMAAEEDDKSLFLVKDRKLVDHSFSHETSFL